MESAFMNKFSLSGLWKLRLRTAFPRGEVDAEGAFSLAAWKMRFMNRLPSGESRCTKRTFRVGFPRARETAIMNRFPCSGKVRRVKCKKAQR